MDNQIEGETDDKVKLDAVNEGQEESEPDEKLSVLTKDETEQEQQIKKSADLWKIPPWPEWSDSVINEQIWDSNNESARFKDPCPPKLPPPFEVVKWVNPGELFKPPVLVDYNDPSLDLVTSNIHLCEKSDILRFMLCEIAELYDLGLERPFHIDGEGSAFVSNPDPSAGNWKPWDHIYSCCKAGVEGERPAINAGGKYFVRLYFMGSWRRIVVDDEIPILADDKLGLPVTSKNELWPMILVKALLKIASLKWGQETGQGLARSREFSTVTALTGWIAEWTDIIEPMTPSALWSQMSDVLPKYQGESHSVINYWTTGKTRKQRLEEEKNKEEKKEVVKAADDLMNQFWWSHLSLADKDPDINYMMTDEEIRILSPSPKPPASDMSIASISITSTTDKPIRRKTKSRKRLDIVDTESSIGNQKKRITKHYRGSDIGVRGVSLSKGLAQNKEKAPKAEKDRTTGPRKTKSVDNLDRNGSMQLMRTLSKKIIEVRSDETVIGGPAKNELAQKRKSRRKTKSLKGDRKPTTSNVLVNFSPNDYQTATAPMKPNIPMLQDILQGVVSYSSLAQNMPVILNLESTLGINKPENIMAVLSLMPTAEGKVDPVAPASLYHPINLVEVRDVSLPADSSQEEIPLWKTFRWKAWAMKKGLIPTEIPLGEVRSIKAKTPIALTNSWYRKTPSPLPPAVIKVCKPKAKSIDPVTINVELHEEVPKLLEKKRGRRRSVESLSPSRLSPRQSVSMHNRSRSRLKLKRDKSVGVGGGKEKSEKSINHIEQGWDKRKSIRKQSRINDTRKDEPPPEPPTTPPTTPTGQGESEKVPSPKSACGSLWFHCKDISPFLKKICKFYPTQSPFGSSFILYRLPVGARASSEESLIPAGNSSTLTTVHKIVENFHEIGGSKNLTVQMGTSGTLPIQDYHLDKKHGIESAFYIFSDYHIPQEILIHLEILQGQAISEAEQGQEDEEEGTEDQDDLEESVNLSIAVEYYDWRKSHVIQRPEVHCSTDSSWSSRITLPPGRNAMRLWIAENVKDVDDISELKGLSDSAYSIKIYSKIPLHVGSLDELLAYMTNEPITFLKQCDDLSQNLWAMCLYFGQDRKSYAPIFHALRHSYYPIRKSPQRPINRELKGIHSMFEEHFVHLIKELNSGKLHRRTLLALKCFFLNPNLGQSIHRTEVLHFKEKVHPKLRAVEDDELPPPGESGDHHFETLEYGDGKVHAALTIQRYCRGWLTRRLFQMRNKHHRKFPLVEYEIRKVAYILASNCDSPFSQPQHEEEGAPENKKLPNLNTIIPNPPKWSVALLKRLLKEYPDLLQDYPHWECFPYHVKIRETEGSIPFGNKNCHCEPFFRRAVCVVGDESACSCLIKLSVSPFTNVVLRVIDNDNKICLQTPESNIFVGDLNQNQLGYTILCYRKEKPELISEEQQAELHRWKVQIVTRKDRDHLAYRDEIQMPLTRTSGPHPEKHITPIYLAHLMVEKERLSMSSIASSAVSSIVE